MKQDFINLDFFNENFSARIDEIEHCFSSVDAFYELTKFPYRNNLLFVNVEPSRNIYFVNYADGTQHHDEHSDEVKWLMTHIPEVKYAIAQDSQGNSYTPTLRDYRNAYLNSTDYLVTRHQEEKLLNKDTTLNEEKFAEVLAYRQGLRDITKKFNSIDNVEWPVNPLL
jgi:hypothetical protein